MRIIDARRRPDIDAVEVTDSVGNKYLVHACDFEYMEKYGGLNREFAPAPPKTKIEDLQAKPVEKTPEKNSLKRVYYHNRLRKK
jgi:hypothetical protein